MIDYADQTPSIILPQLSAVELSKINTFINRRISACERHANWRQALKLLHRKLTVIELLAKREP